MADLTYLVSIDMQVKGGGAGGALDKASAGADRVSKRLERISTLARSAGSTMVSSFTGVVESVGNVSYGLAKMGAGLAVGAAMWGVKLNSELETTQTSIAAVLKAQDQVGSMDEGLGRAATMVAQMKKDARELPGEFRDLQYILQSSLTSGLNAGLSPESMQRMSAQVMAAGKAMSVPLDQAGREFAMLLEGRAGAHNVFGTRLGIKADGFNQLDSAKRIEIIAEALQKFQPSIKAFGRTWDAASSTMIDHAKSFIGLATKPLFEKAKETLFDINRWFEANGDTTDEWARDIGWRLRNAFVIGTQTIQEWWPAISAFATNAERKLSQVWATWGPTLETMGASMREWMKDPKAMEDIAETAKLYAGLKIGVPIGTGLFGLGSAIFGGGGAAAGGAAAAGAGAAGAGTGAAGVAAAGGLAAVATAAAAVVLALGGVGLAAWQGYELFKESQGFMNEEERNRAAAVVHLQAMIDAHRNAGTELDMSSANWQNAVGNLIAAGGELEASLLSAAAASTSAAASFNAAAAKQWGPAGVEASKWGGAPGVGGSLNYIMAAAQGSANAFLDGESLRAEQAAKKAAKDKKGGGGGGGNVMKVEITISSNQAPGQIAREIKNELVSLQRHPRTSSGVRNFSAAPMR